MGRIRSLLEVVLFAAIVALSAGVMADDGVGNGPNGTVPEFFAAGDVIRSFPAPGAGDPRGLTFDGTDVWVAGNNTKMMYRLDAMTGAVLSSFPTPGASFTQGVAWDGTFLWHAEYNGNLYQYLPNGTLIGTTSTPTAQPTGLTWDGTYLWTADYNAEMIYQFDTTGMVVNSFPSPTPNPWGVAWDGGALWTSSTASNEYIKLNPATGAVIDTIAAPPGGFPLGQDCQSASLLWSVGHNTDTIYLIDLGGGGVAEQLFTGTAINDTGTANDVYVIDVTTDVANSIFGGRAVWGATYDVANERVLFTSDGGAVGGAPLYAWTPAPGAPTVVGTITDGAVDFRIDGLAISGGTLYGARAAGLDDGIYEINMSTLVATLVFPFTDSISGIDADPVTGTIYGVNDTTQNLVVIDVIGGIVTPIAAYPDAAETDIDGIAVGGGKAYLVPDDIDPGLIYVYDIASGTWDTPLTAPWGAIADTFSGGAFVTPSVGLPFDDGFESGDTSQWSGTGP